MSSIVPMPASVASFPTIHPKMPPASFSLTTQSPPNTQPVEAKADRQMVSVGAVAKIAAGLGGIGGFFEGMMTEDTRQKDVQAKREMNKTLAKMAKKPELEGLMNNLFHEPKGGAGSIVLVGILHALMSALLSALCFGGLAAAYNSLAKKEKTAFSGSD